MTVHLPGHAPGPFSKAIYVCARNYDHPVALLQVVGDLETGLTITPSVLNFGTLQPNETQSRQLTVTYDARLAPAGDLPPLVGETTAIKVTPIPDPAPVAPAPPLRTKRYTVTVHSAHAGKIIASLSFAPPSATATKGALPAETIDATLSSAAILVSCQIK
jgi:hypothetical protein